MARRVALVVLLVVASACATVKPCPPCPPAEVGTVLTPVVRPVPEPPPLSEPVSALLALDPETAPVEDLVQALLVDRDHYLRTLREALRALNVYRSTPE